MENGSVKDWIDTMTHDKMLEVLVIMEFLEYDNFADTVTGKYFFKVLKSKEWQNK